MMGHNTLGDLLAQDTFVRQKQIGHDSKEIALPLAACCIESSPSGSPIHSLWDFMISLFSTGFLPSFNSSTPRRAHCLLKHQGPRYRWVASKLLAASCREASARDRARSSLQFCPKHLIHACPPQVAQNFMEDLSWPG